MQLIIHNLALDVFRRHIEPLMGEPTLEDRSVEIDDEIVRAALIKAVQNMTADQLQALVSLACEFGRPS